MSFDSLAANYAEALAAFKAAEAAKDAASLAIVAAMQDAGERTIITTAGKFTLISGRRTIKITCPALKAEIKLMEERAIRTGRAEENHGRPYVRFTT